MNAKPFASSGIMPGMSDPTKPTATPAKRARWIAPLVILIVWLGTRFDRFLFYGTVIREDCQTDRGCTGHCIYGKPYCVRHAIRPDTTEPPGGWCLCPTSRGEIEMREENRARAARAFEAAMLDAGCVPADDDGGFRCTFKDGGPSP